MRTLIAGFPHDWQIDIINRCNINPIYWVAHELGNRKLIPDHVVFHDMMEAEANIGSSEMKKIKIKYLDDVFFLEHPEFVDVVMRTYYLKQNTLYNKTLFISYNNMRLFFYKQVAYWHYVLSHYKIELVLVESLPHDAVELIIYYLAKIKQIPLLFCSRTSLEPTRFFICESMDDFTPQNDPKNKLSDTIANITPLTEMPSYCKQENVPTNYSKALIKSLKNKGVLRSLKEICSKRNIYLLRGKVLQRYLKYIYFHEYNKYTTDRIDVKKYVYFPLSMQPEDTTYPIGKNFVDQIYAVGYLSELLPDDIIILVKEHPNQKFEERGRHKGYYKKLSEIDKVQLVDIKTSSFELITNSIAVASINGHAGWEAITNDIPAITFSNPWYQDCPFVFNIELLKKQRGFFKENIEGAQIDKDKINTYYDALLKSTFEGFTTSICQNSSNLAIEENIKKVSDALNLKLSQLTNN